MDVAGGQRRAEPAVPAVAVASVETGVAGHLGEELAIDRAGAIEEALSLLIAAGDDGFAPLREVDLGFELGGLVERGVLEVSPSRLDHGLGVALLKVGAETRDVGGALGAARGLAEVGQGGAAVGPVEIVGAGLEAAVSQSPLVGGGEGLTERDGHLRVPLPGIPGALQVDAGRVGLVEGEVTLAQGEVAR